MNTTDYVEIVITPTLKFLAPEISYSKDAENLILLTAIAESDLKNLRQYNNGPARGLLQMEPATEASLWKHYLSRKQNLKDKILRLMSPGDDFDNLAGNLFYQCAMARVKYFPDPAPMPLSSDVDGVVDYYIRIYNGGGKATVKRTRDIYINKVLSWE